jgi:hypothetical protein
MLHKLIFDKKINEIRELLKKMKTSNEELFRLMLNQIDLRGNTPVFLTVLLRQKNKDDLSLMILMELLKYNADVKIRNLERWTPLELATSNEDVDAVCLIYDHILWRRLKKIKENKGRAALFLKQTPNFYIEMKWEVNVPLLSFLCPNDICKIWKFEDNVRMDYTFLDYKNMITKRSPMSYIFQGHGIQKEFFQVNWKQEQYFNPFEPLDEEEKALVIKEIMNSHRVNAEFKIKKCDIQPSQSTWNKKPVMENVNEWKSQKYDINISAFFNMHNKEKLEYINLNEKIYFDQEEELKRNITLIYDENDLKEKLADSFHVKNQNIRKNLMKLGNNKEKNLKANVWIAQNFPIQSSHLVNLFTSISSANEFTQKLNEFFKNKEVKNIIDNDGFPIKLKIPVNFFIDISVTFMNYKSLDSQSSENYGNIMEKFEIPSKFKRISRKRAINLKEDYKKRVAYANMP